jgi:hypothetical protein
MIEKMIKTRYPLSHYVKKLFANPWSVLLSLFSPSLMSRRNKNYVSDPLDETISIDTLVYLKTLSHPEGKNAFTKIHSVNSFLVDSGVKKFQDENRKNSLMSLFNKMGSDKSRIHNYHEIYQPLIDSIFEAKDKVRVVEIGLGSSYLTGRSNMGIFGHHGASAFALTNFDPRISYLGGDIEKRSFVQAERIESKFVDQTKIESLKDFVTSESFDLFIDDGLHVPNSNFNSLVAGIVKSNKDNWLLIEDIDAKYQDFWKMIISEIDHLADSWLVETQACLVLAMRRK